MSGYGTSRDDQYESRLATDIQNFISQYGANTSADRRTIFLFPGGLGSQLMRADAAYPNTPTSYTLSWIDCGILSGEALDLRMQPGEIDFEQRYIVPNGCVDFIINPYGNFIQWCQNNFIDLFVLGWDWRRSSAEAADFFLNDFLPTFDVMCANLNPHPLDNFALVGHSAGGMVVKMILNSSTNTYLQRLKKAITVATPFYGYGGQVHRYFKGDADLDWTLPGTGASTYTKVISSLPGPYEYLFLDYGTYQNNALAFKNDPEGYNLDAYPSLDKANPGEIADPYNPQPDAEGLVRYPVYYGFSSSFLSSGEIQSQNLSSALPPTIAAKFYNIRGVQSQNGNELDGTVVSQLWQRVAASFDPDTDPDPIEDQMGPGDGTQPAWTTRLLSLPDPTNQVITIVDDDLEHMVMMNHPDVQKQIALLLGLDPYDMTFIDEDIDAASRSDLDNFFSGLSKQFDKEGFDPERRKMVIAEYVRKFPPGELRRLFRRAYIDALKSPSQKTVRGSGESGKTGAPPDPDTKKP
jgi:pimeloyl-ACP methyl ester carboxylesterase